MIDTLTSGLSVSEAHRRQQSGAVLLDVARLASGASIAAGLIERRGLVPIVLAEGGVADVLVRMSA